MTEIPQVPFWILFLITWDFVWKTMALWKSARNGQKFWFIALALINSVGILPLIYLVFFRKGKVKNGRI